MAADAASSPTRVTAAVTVRPPAASSAPAKPSASSPGRILDSASSHAASTTCRGGRRSRMISCANSAPSSSSSRENSAFSGSCAPCAATCASAAPSSAPSTPSTVASAVSMTVRVRVVLAAGRRPRSTAARRFGPPTSTVAPSPRRRCPGSARCAASHAVADGATTTGLPRNRGSAPQATAYSAPVGMITSSRSPISLRQRPDQPRVQAPARRDAELDTAVASGAGSQSGASASRSACSSWAATVTSVPSPRCSSRTRPSHTTNARSRCWTEKTDHGPVAEFAITSVMVRDRAGRAPRAVPPAEPDHLPAQRRVPGHQLAARSAAQPRLLQAAAQVPVLAHLLGERGSSGAGSGW